MTLSQIRKIILIFTFAVFFTGIGYWYGKGKITIQGVGSLGTTPKITVDRNVPNNRNVDFTLFWSVWDRLDESYLRREGLDAQKMVYGAISGMVASLGDPYTVFLPPTDQKQSKEDLAGSFEGVGIQLGYKDSKMAVVAPLKDTPAEKAGIKAGDFILRIKDPKKNIDKDTSTMSLPEAVEIIRGEAGTSVILSILTAGATEPKEISLVRSTIVVKSVEVAYEGKIATLKLSRFGEKTNQEWDDVVASVDEKIKKGEVKGIVLDMRNNPGGFLQGAIYVASEFLADGVIVKQEQSGGQVTQTFSVDRKGKLTKIPLVVLINEGSASASEIVAGALKERGRAKVVGEKSFGKGTIQEAEELSNGSGLHVTIAKWLLPNNKNIDKEGITPDFVIKPDVNDQTKDVQLEKAIELLK